MSWHFLKMRAPSVRHGLLAACLLGPCLAIGLAPQAPECAWRQALAIPCPGCGLGHALTALGEGQVLLAWQAYPPLPMLVLLWLACLAVLTGGSRHLNRALPWTAAATLCVVMGNWVVSLLT